MSVALLLGDRSEIGGFLGNRLKEDGWKVYGWNRTTHPRFNEEIEPWNLILCALGQMGAVGHWTKINPFDGLYYNSTFVIDIVRWFWEKRLPEAKVCFLAGSNPNKATPNYLAYNMGKMALLKAVETIDAETPEATFFTLAPGFVSTKFHQATLDAGLKDARLGTTGTPLPRIYDCLKWCLRQPKHVIGGRNIHINDPWDTQELSARLLLYPDLYKLRRIE